MNRAGQINILARRPVHCHLHLIMWANLNGQPVLTSCLNTSNKPNHTYVKQTWLIVTPVCLYNRCVCFKYLCFLWSCTYLLHYTNAILSPLWLYVGDLPVHIYTYFNLIFFAYEVTGPFSDRRMPRVLGCSYLVSCIRLLLSSKLAICDNIGARCQQCAMCSMNGDRD